MYALLVLILCVWLSRRLLILLVYANLNMEILSIKSYFRHHKLKSLLSTFATETDKLG